VIRISGDRAGSILRGLWVGSPPVLAGRALVTGRVHDGRGEQPALVLWMPGPRSLTREDVVELHVPGAPPLLAALLDRVLALGAVAAGRGEFTRRAFLSGRIDLLRAEGVLSLVEAQSEAERRAASALLFGGLSDRIDVLRDKLSDARALAEASLDFDESDTGHVPDEELVALARSAHAGLEHALSWEERRGAARGEPRVVLFGAPNAGKSLLYNALTGADAIVSDVPGTTRDVLGAPWNVGGVSCRLVDTAGLERADVRGAHGAAQLVAGDQRSAADLVLWVVDATRADTAVQQAESSSVPPGVPCLLVWNQSDRPQAKEQPPRCLARHEWVSTSGRTGAGFESLERAVALALGLEPSAAQGEYDPAAARSGEVARELSARHRHALRAAADEVARALAARAEGEPLDLFAAGLRAATDELDAITGRTTAESVLDRVFARFCIGK